MRTTRVLFVFSLLGLAACEGQQSGSAAERAAAGASASAAGVQVPTLRAGRWRTSTVVHGAAAPVAPVIACIQAPQKANVAMAERLTDLDCSERSVTREGAEIVSRAVCEVDGARQTYVSRARGDFESDFFVDTVVTRDPALGGASEYRATVHSRWLGRC